MFCKHKWELVSETTTKSKFKHAMEQVVGMSKGRFPWQLCDASRKHIQIIACKTCGKLKRFVENI